MIKVSTDVCWTRTDMTSHISAFVEGGRQLVRATTASTLAVLIEAISYSLMASIID